MAWCHLFAAKAGEGRLVVGVDRSSAAVTTTAGGTTTGSTTAGTAPSTGLTTAATGRLATASATTTATTTAATATLLGSLNEAVLKLDDLLLLALTLALGLATGAGEVILGLLDEFLGLVPLLVESRALVGLADLQGIGSKSGLLLGLLDKVVGVRDGLILLLGLSSRGGGVSLSILGISLGDGLGGLLVLELGLTLVATPSLSSSLVGTTVGGGLAVALVLSAWVAGTTATTDTGLGTTTGVSGVQLGITRTLIAGSTNITVAERTIVAGDLAGRGKALRGALHGVSLRLLDDSGRLLGSVVLIFNRVAEQVVHVLSNDRHLVV